jgi:MFS family permease
VTSGAWKALMGLFVLTMGTSIITPLLPLYQDHFGLSTGTLTLLFVTYTVTVVPTMLLAGNLSDRLGRKWLMLPSMAILTIASLVFSLSDSVPLLFVGRVLQGLGIGGFLGVGVAFVVDHARPNSKALAATLGGVFFRVGFGLGPGLAGIIAHYSSDPRHRPFEFHVVLMVLGMVAVALAGETVVRRRGEPFRIRIGVPEGQMRGFLTFLAPATFMMSFLEGTLLSVVPIYVVRTLDVHNLVLIGLIGFLILGAGAATPFLVRGLDPRRSVMIGVAVSSVESLLVVGASQVGTVALVVAAAAAIGFTNGFILMGGTVICGTIVPIEERGKLLSVLYMCAYAGTLPVVGLGYLSTAIGLTATLAVFSAVALLLAAFVLIVGRRLFVAVIPYRPPLAAPEAPAPASG